MGIGRVSLKIVLKLALMRRIEKSISRHLIGWQILVRFGAIVHVRQVESGHCRVRVPGVSQHETPARPILYRDWETSNPQRREWYPWGRKG